MKKTFTQNLIDTVTQHTLRVIGSLSLLFMVAYTSQAQLTYTPTVCNDAYVQVQGQPGATFVGLGDDATFTVTLPFLFQFYNTNYTQMLVGTNGFAVFLPGTARGFTNATLPTATAGACLYPYWDDQNITVATGGANAGMYTRVEGTAPNRTFTIEWFNAGHFGGATLGENITFQVKLFENGYRIQYKYLDVVFGGTQAAFNNAASATVGLEDILPAPRRNTLVGFNVANTVVSGQCIEFVLSGPCNPVSGAPLTIGTDPGTCLATLNLAVAALNPPGCATGAPNGLRYRIDNGPFTVLTFPLPANIVFPNLAGGVHYLNWHVFVVATGQVAGTSTQIIVVQDQEPPVLSGCNDVTIDLAPGECSAQLSYVLDATDNCGFPSPNQTFQLTDMVVGNQGQAGTMFDIENVGTNPITITSANVHIRTGAFNYQTYITTSASTYLGIVQAGVPGASNAAWTFLGQQAVAAVLGTPTVLNFNDFTLQPGESRGIYITSLTSIAGGPTVAEALGTTPPAGPALVTNGDLERRSGILLTNLTGAGFGNGAGDIIYGDAVNPPPTVDYWNLEAILNYSEQIPNVAQTAGLPSGSQFPIGTTTNCFSSTDAAGNVGTCCFSVEVNEYAGPVLSSLTCNDLIQLSLDENCSACLGADEVLEGGPYMCYDDYIVERESAPGVWVPACFGPGQVGQLITVRVIDPVTLNTCWGQVSVEDKLPPTIVCEDITLPCGISTDPVFTPPVTGSATFSVNPELPVGPNAGTLTSAPILVSLPGNAVVTDVNVTLDLDHTFSLDLRVDLISPNGEPVVLANGVCAGNDNWDFVTFDDEAGIPLTCNPTPPPALTGTMRPQQALANLDGNAASGVWTLTALDQIGLDGGTLHFVSITINYLLALPQAPDATDNCDANVTLTYEDVQVGELCDTIELQRTWTATDDSGSSAQCVQTITIVPLSLVGLECPPTFLGECGGSTHPDFTGGYPTVGGIEIVPGGVCNMFVSYWDKEFDDCGNGTKIVRTWTVLDWCTQTTQECEQVIKLTDDEGPWLECPADQTVGSDPWFCNRDVVLEVPYADDHCGTPFTLTPSVEGDAGELIHFGGNFWRVDNLPVGTFAITWTAVDDCGNVSSCSYDLTVVDDVPPVPICDEHTIVSLTFDNGLDHGLTKIYAPTFDDGSHDNCGPVTFLVRRMPPSCIDFDWIGHAPNYPEYPNNDGGLPESVDQGLTFQPWVPFACCDVGETVMVELRVTDIYGNINSCMVEVEVQDKLPPLIVCPPDITVSCDFWFDAHETDGFEPTDGLEDVFGRVLDAYDYDESDREYVIVDDPGNPYLPQPYHWGLDGWADDNCDIDVDVRTRLFDDCSGNDLPGGAPEWAVRLVERTFRAQDRQGNTSTCRQRIWVVDYDPFYISDESCGLNNADDVRWPCDLVLTDCPEGELTPDNLSQYAPNNRPIVYDDNCSIIGVTYEDQIFYFVDNACYKIVRTWTVIDWCQFESDGEGGHYGYWTYVQVIKVHDHDGAEFLDCPDGPLTYCVEDPNVELPSNNQVFLGESDPNSSSCSVHVWESRTVYETCSDLVIYDVKIYPYNGDEYVQIVAKTTVPVDTNGEAVLTWDTRQNSLPSNHSIRRYGLPYNDRYCSNWPLSGGVKDYHRVLWSVEDGCGNLSTCEYLFRLEDCKKPTPICVGLSSVVMPTTGAVTIWAKDFDSGSSVDDCTAHEDLLFSFSGTTYQPSRVFDCEAIEENGSPSFLVEIWVVDEGNDQNCNGFIQPLGIEYGERNKDFCTTFIVIDDNEGVCPGGPGIGGSIETEELETVELVTVRLTDPVTGDVIRIFNTEENGFYQFINLNPLLDYNVDAARGDNHKNGVSTLDLVKIQKHLLGIQLLDSPYKLIAADANNSESVSALDLVEIRKLILGLYNEFPKNESWRFVASDFTFSDPTNPWPFEEVMESHGMQMDHDFVGVKVGDVNGNVVANATQVQVRNAKGILEFVTEAQSITAGQIVSVPVSAKNFASVLGYQFTMKTAGLTLNSVISGALDMSAENIGVHDNAITISWNRVAPTSSSDVLFTLSFEATESGVLSEMLSINTKSKLTEAEAYNASEEILDVTLSFRNSVQSAGKDFALFQNEPNPFEGSTVIGFTLPEAMDATVTVYDVTGKVVHMIEGSYAQGYNEVKVSRKDLSSTGVMYYRLDAIDFTATKKMVVID